MDAFKYIYHLLTTKMDTFTNIYHNSIIQCLTLYENEKKHDGDNIIYMLELEYNEERGIEVELHLNKNEVINIFNVFHLIVSDARFAYSNGDSSQYDDVQDYIECKLGANKLNFLVGDEIYNTLMTCTMDYKV